MRAWQLASAALCVFFWAACTADTAPEPRAHRRQHTEPDAADGGNAAPALTDSARPAFCSRDGADLVRDVFCAETQPAISSLLDLMALVKADPIATPTPGLPTPPTAPGYRRFVALLGHSTALSGHVISPINPRAIVLGQGTLLAFQRGTQRVELATNAHDGSQYHFYLVTFEQDCNASKAGCKPGDLYTPRIESDWKSVVVREDEDLKDTPLDCRQCHQRGLDRPTLLMRELESPWTHFFLPADTGITLPGVNGTDLTKDYLAAKGDEPYAGFDVTTLSLIGAFMLQTAVPLTQPLLFNAPQIEAERYPRGAQDVTAEPMPSPTWEHGYEAFKRGEQLALPYLDARVTDPDKLAQLTAAYASYRAGELAAEELPDLADVFPDDPHLRAQIGLQTEPDATPVEALIQACGTCHNDVLDQTVSRAHFNVDLSRLERAELDAAADRIQRPRAAPGAMPPPEARQLDPGARDRLVDYLRHAATGEPDEQLVRAATLGMKGGEGMGRYQ